MKLPFAAIYVSDNSDATSRMAGYQRNATDTFKKLKMYEHLLIGQKI